MLVWLVPLRPPPPPGSDPRRSNARVRVRSWFARDPYELLPRHAPEWPHGAAGPRSAALAPRVGTVAAGGDPRDVHQTDDHQYDDHRFDAAHRNADPQTVGHHYAGHHYVDHLDADHHYVGHRDADHHDAARPNADLHPADCRFVGDPLPLGRQRDDHHSGDPHCRDHRSGDPKWAGQNPADLNSVDQNWDDHPTSAVNGVGLQP